MADSPFVYGFDHADSADKPTDKQMWFLKRNHEAILDVLTPMERTNATVMGVEVFLSTLNKSEASALIGRVKGEKVARDTLRRSDPETEEPPKKKWFDTGFSEES